MTDAERASYEKLIESMMEAARARELLIRELEAEIAALRAQIAGQRPN